MMLVGYPVGLGKVVAESGLACAAGVGVAVGSGVGVIGSGESSEPGSRPIVHGG
jgi:hypothetical protein